MSENKQAGELGADVSGSIQRIQDTLETMLDSADVRRVFAEPVEKGDVSLIPAAEIVSVVGMGAGSGTGTTEDEQSGRQVGRGGGGGGGGKAFSRPVAVIVASPQGVRVEPVIDVTKIGLTAITAAGFMLAVFLRLARPKRALKELKR